jgi:hypothetical protein
MNSAVAIVPSILSGSLQMTLLVLVLGGAAAALDWVVRWLCAKRFSPGLCAMLHGVSMVLVAIDCALIVAHAAAHAWEVRPSLMRNGAYVAIVDGGSQPVHL